MIPMNRNLLPLRRSPIRTFTNLANETPGCIKLTIGEPDGATPDAVVDAAAAPTMPPTRAMRTCAVPSPPRRPPGATKQPLSRCSSPWAPPRRSSPPCWAS